MAPRKSMLGKLGWRNFLVRYGGANVDSCFAPEFQLSMLDVIFRTPRFDFVRKDPMRGEQPHPLLELRRQRRAEELRDVLPFEDLRELLRLLGEQELVDGEDVPHARLRHLV